MMLVILLVLHVKSHIGNVLLRYRQFVLSFLVLRIVAHILHLILAVLLILIVLHSLVMSQRTSIKVRLVHLHGVDLTEVCTASKNVHVHH